MSASKPTRPLLFFTLKDIAERLDMTVRGVRKMVARGEIPATRLGRRYVVPISLFEQTLVERAQAFSADPWSS